MLIKTLEGNYSMSKLEKLKKEMIAWRDFYEQDIPCWDRIEAATTPKELYQIMQDHRHFLELQATDAETHLDKAVEKMFEGYNTLDFN